MRELAQAVKLEKKQPGETKLPLGCAGRYSSTNLGMLLLGQQGVNNSFASSQEQTSRCVVAWGAAAADCYLCSQHPVMPHLIPDCHLGTGWA